MRKNQNNNEKPKRTLHVECLENRRMLAGDVAATAVSPDLMRGDADGNGTVEFADFLQCAENFGSTEATWQDGDFNGDRTVDFTDFTMLANNFGKLRPSTDSAASSDEVDSYNNQDRVQFATRLSGAGPVHGEAEYEVEHGGAKREFEVEVESGAPNSVYDVSVDAVVIGQIATDEFGRGRLKFSTVPKGGELQLPEDFPAVADGSSIAVGDVMSGQFSPVAVDDDSDDAKDDNSDDNSSDDDVSGHDNSHADGPDRDNSDDDDTDDDDTDDDDTDDDDTDDDDTDDDDTDDDDTDDDDTDDDDTDDDDTDDDDVGDGDDENDREHDREHDREQNEIEVKARLSGRDGAHGEAEFESEHAGVDVEFEVEVEGADPDTTYAVMVDNIFAGNVTTDNRGRGKLELSTEPEEDEGLLPADFPAIGVDTTIAVGNLLTGVFDVDS